MTVSFAVPDWEEKLRRGETPLPDLPIDKDRADQAQAIFDRLRVPDIPGQPTFGESSGPWFRDLIRTTFGAIDPETRARLVSELFILVPKKNGKTTYSAAMGLVALLLNTTPNVEMLIVGPTKPVADTCFRQVCGMISSNKDLRALLHVREHLKQVRNRATGATLSVKASDVQVLTGAIPALVIVDELHVMSSKSYARGVMAQIEGGMITNPDSLLVVITTQSEGPPVGVFKEKLAYARGVRDGRITERVSTLPVIYEFPEAVQLDERRLWKDPDLWPMVLPNLGYSIEIDRLRDLYAQAKEAGVEALTLWASQHLNIQIGLGLHSERWLGVDHWQAATEPTLTLDALLDSSEVVVAGIDGGGMDDLMALALIGRHRDTKVWQVWAKAWVQPEAIERRAQNAETYHGFVEDGDLVICDWVTQDIEEIAALVAMVRDRGLLPEVRAVGLDPYGVGALIDELAQAGLEGDLLAGIGQGARLSPAIWGAERKLANRTMVHGGQPLLNWAVGNAKAEQRGNALVITKQSAGSAKIDPLMALFDAFMLMSSNPVAQGHSVYADRGALVI